MRVSLKWAKRTKNEIENKAKICLGRIYALVPKIPILWMITMNIVFNLLIRLGAVFGFEYRVFS